MQTWQDKFYELAEIYLDTEALAKYACNKLTVSRAELLKQFELDTDPRRREAFQTEGRKVVTRIRDSQDDVGVVDKKKAEEVAKKLEIKKKQRENVKKSKVPFDELFDI